jgi:3-methyladenine DNA glycosylase AlkC
VPDGPWAQWRGSAERSRERCSTDRRRSAAPPYPPRVAEAAPAKLKTFFSPDLVRRIGASVAESHAGFDQRAFARDASRGLEELELLDRARQRRRDLPRALPESYPDALDVLLRSLGPEHATDELLGLGMEPFFYLPHVLFVAERGLDHFDLSMRAHYELTKRFTAEAGIRPFLAKDPERALTHLREWSRDANAHVRRLVSEGTRLRLPWAMRVPWLDANPRAVLALLEPLKDDPTTLVRRSVANNLNDLGKLHPRLLTETCERWLANASRERRALVEHALRTAVKRGDRIALRLVGYDAKPKIAIDEATFTPNPATIGERVTLDLMLRSTAAKPQDLLVDLAVHFVKANGTTSPKIFKLKRLTLPARAAIALSTRISLAIHTTRKPYPGEHRVDLLVNGTTFPAGAFGVRERSSSAC